MYHKELKKNKYNCIGPPVFKSQRYREGYQSNKKLFHTISMQKISSIYKFNLKIQHILGSHDLRCHTYPKSLKKPLAFNFF